MKPVENMFVSFVSGGDGWHNYHHVFPWDYRNSEYWDYKLNISTLFIDFFALFGWAYDLKTVPPKMIAQRVRRTGDGSHPVWGWKDTAISNADRRITRLTNIRK